MAAGVVRGNGHDGSTITIRRLLNQTSGRLSARNTSSDKDMFE
ncbi:hypothetical protein [Nocardia sp. NBC_00403]